MKRKVRNSFTAAVGVLAAAAGITACGGDGNGESTAAAAKSPATSLPKGSETVNLNPADFTTRIDNPYWPMRPGSRWVYREVHPEDLTVERVVVTVTNKTKKIANGIEARVVRDVASEKGVPTEVTDDWYAQDSAGNVWYMGEATTEYVNGKPGTTAGSFEAGVDGAQAGIIMPADPRDGMAYRQEYYEREAEDRAEVLSLDEKAEAPFGYFEQTLMTKDLVPLEPKVSEHKFYAEGVGLVLALDISGGSGREELISYTEGG